MGQALHPGPCVTRYAPGVSPLAAVPVSTDRRVQLVIDPDLMARLKALAKAHRRSASSEICMAIEAWLNQHKAELDG